jgi:hypothetical protein
VIDNNCFLSPLNVWNLSTGSAFVNNLFAGQICKEVENVRYTPYHFPHSTKVAGIMTTQGGDDRYLNNIFIKTPPPAYDIFENANRPKRKMGTMGYGLQIYDDYPSTIGSSTYFVSEMSEVKLPVIAENNLYLNGAICYKYGHNEMEDRSPEAELHVDQNGDSVYLMLTTANDIAHMDGRIVSSTDLGEAIIPQVPFEDSEGKTILFNKDYNGEDRNGPGNSVGPFSRLKVGRNIFRLWPKYTYK